MVPISRTLYLMRMLGLMMLWAVGCHVVAPYQADPLLVDQLDGGGDVDLAPDLSLPDQLFRLDTEPLPDAVVEPPPLDALADAQDEPVFHWATGVFGLCTVPCGPGVKIRSVVCENEGGAVVSELNCTDPKPLTDMPCDAGPCCLTPPLQQGLRCDGTVLSQAVHFGSNTGSPEDVEQCANQCTTWATSDGLSDWCCNLYEDASGGKAWVCRLNATHGYVTVGGPYYGSLGNCQ